jgi:hypothetical protein
MPSRVTRLIVVSSLVFLASAACAHAAARAVFGTSWSGQADRLQSIVDAAYGSGRINVRVDYLGADPGEPDQIVWSSAVWPILRVREISGTAHRAGFGWYVESGNPLLPPLDGHNDGPVFKNDRAAGSTTVLNVRSYGRNIGFYLHTRDAGSGLGERTFFTNRWYNDVGPGGAGPLHEPLEGGDIQALVFDVSAWTQPSTWLVCFENRDSGALPGSCCDGTDNDYADYVFEVRAEGVTATLAPTFGLLKKRYRD